MSNPLPVDPHVPEIVSLVRSRRAAVIVAPPGAGKTTRIPPALAEEGKAILLQPRRVAARALARRIAEERRWVLGDEVGWQVRFERRFSRRTRLLVATEGILTERLIADPLLGDFRTVILDEFHERSLHADLALALVVQAARARPDLAVVVMSATLDAQKVSGFLGGAPVVEIPGRRHPLSIRYDPGRDPADAVTRLLVEVPRGHLLVFLPGAPEIRRLAGRLGGVREQALVLPLHGSLEPEAQDLALAPSERRKVILATNLAETSLTVDGVSAVVDTGLHKVARHDTGTALDRLETERISRDSAEQRAGRAGRTGPGIAVRLWDPRDHLRSHREPEIERVDLSGPFLHVLAWGGNPLQLEWFEPPPDDRAMAAMETLERLGATRCGHLTEVGRSLAAMPIHPRLARILLEAGGTSRAALACAVLSEGFRPPASGETTHSDLLSAVDRIGDAPEAVRRTARELERLAAPFRPRGPKTPTDDDALRRALLCGFPDRVARRREPRSSRFVLASGHGAVLLPESGVRSSEYVVALDLVGGSRGPQHEARVRLASAIEPEWLIPTAKEVLHLFDAASGRVRAIERQIYGSLVLRERPVTPDPDRAAEKLVEALVARGLDERSRGVLRRLRFAGLEVDVKTALRTACEGRTRLPELDLLSRLSPEVRREMERRAPEWLTLPGGRRTRLDFRDDGTVAASVKVQDLFGVAESPRVGTPPRPVILHLLSPGGRTVQTTRDLRSFWDRGYAEVRRELRARYPRHAWPEDPWQAKPPSGRRGR